MPVNPQVLQQVLSTPESLDLEESPIVWAVILTDAGNAADLVPALDEVKTLKASNARKILVLFGPPAVPPLLAALGVAGPEARMEGLEILWALLTGEDTQIIREMLTKAWPDLDLLLQDTRTLPDQMPEHIERDFRGRICDLAYIVIRQLLDPEFDQSVFRALDDPGRGEEIQRLRGRGFGLRIV